MDLAELIFSDLFVGTEPAACWYKQTPDSLTAMAVPQDCHAELKQLHQALTSHAGSSSFRVQWPINGVKPMRLRVERIVTAHGETIFAIRRYNLAPQNLANLGVPHGVAVKLMDRELLSGLVVFFGRAGSGKTTTAGAFLVERLAAFGGVAWTVENPAELALQGQHGKGWCYQVEVPDESQIGPSIRQLMRATPNLILIGEIRDGRAAAEAITAALSGHLVVTTFHAGDLTSGIARLTRLAESAEKETGKSLADALKVGMHLNLQNYDPKIKAYGMHEVKGTGTPPRVLQVEPLWLTGQNESAIRTILREGDFQQLSSEIERQKRSLMMRGLPT